MEDFLLLGWKGGFCLAGSGVWGSKGSRDRGSNLRLGSNVRVSKQGVSEYVDDCSYL